MFSRCLQKRYLCLNLRESWRLDLDFQPARSTHFPLLPSLHSSFSTEPDNIVRLPIGVPTSIYCLFQNQSPSPLTLTHVAGSLNMPAYFKGYLQNFTVTPLGFVVPPGEEVTVQYEITVRLLLGGKEGGRAVQWLILMWTFYLCVRMYAQVEQLSHIFSSLLSFLHSLN